LILSLAREADELNLRVGDVLTVIRKGWYFGGFFEHLIYRFVKGFYFSDNCLRGYFSFGLPFKRRHPISLRSSERSSDNTMAY
jgi:hypothetical protein